MTRYGRPRAHPGPEPGRCWGAPAGPGLWLAAQPLGGPAVAGHGPAMHLDGDGPVEQQVAGGPDLPHPAGGQRRLHPVAAIEALVRPRSAQSSPDPVPPGPDPRSSPPPGPESPLAERSSLPPGPTCRRPTRSRRPTRGVAIVLLALQRLDLGLEPGGGLRGRALAGPERSLRASRASWIFSSAASAMSLRRSSAAPVPAARYLGGAQAQVRLVHRVGQAIPDLLADLPDRPGSFPARPAWPPPAGPRAPPAPRPARPAASAATAAARSRRPRPAHPGALRPRPSVLGRGQEGGPAALGRSRRRGRHGRAQLGGQGGQGGGLATRSGQEVAPGGELVEGQVEPGQGVQAIRAHGPVVSGSVIWPPPPSPPRSNRRPDAARPAPHPPTCPARRPPGPPTGRRGPAGPAPPAGRPGASGTHPRLGPPLAASTVSSGLSTRAPASLPHWAGCTASSSSTSPAEPAPEVVGDLPVADQEQPGLEVGPGLVGAEVAERTASNVSLVTSSAFSASPSFAGREPATRSR